MAASSLRDLLTEEAYQHSNKVNMAKTKKQLVKHKVAPADESSSLALPPIHICHDPKSYNLFKHDSLLHKGSSTKRVNANSIVVLESSGSTSRSDEVATEAVVSILSGYAARYLKDEEFREKVDEKCRACLACKKRDLDSEEVLVVLEAMENGVEIVNKMVVSLGFSTKAMRECVENLSRVVASFDSENSNSSLSACANLYLVILHKIERNDSLSAKHLLQVFCDAPFLARTHLLPDLWEHLFLPHLLHLKI